MSEFIKISEIDTSKISKDNLVGLSVFNSDEEYLGILVVDDFGEYILKYCFNTSGGIGWTYADDFWVRVEDCEPVTEAWNPTNSEYAIDSNTMKLVKVLSVTNDDTATVIQICDCRPEYIVQCKDLLTKESLDDYKRSQLLGEYSSNTYNAKFYIRQLPKKFDFQNLLGLPIYGSSKNEYGIIVSTPFAIDATGSIPVLHVTESKGVCRCRCDPASYKINYTELVCAELKYEGGDFAIHTQDAVKRLVKIHKDRAENGNFVVKEVFYERTFEADPNDLTTKIFLGSNILRKPIVNNIDDDAGIPLGELLEKTVSDKTKSKGKEMCLTNFQTVTEAMTNVDYWIDLLGNSAYNKDGTLIGVISDITCSDEVTVSDIYGDGNFRSGTYSTDVVYLTDDANLHNRTTVPEEKDLSKGNILQFECLVEVVKDEGSTVIVKKLELEAKKVVVEKYQLSVPYLSKVFRDRWNEFRKDEKETYINLKAAHANGFAGQTVSTEDDSLIGVIVKSNPEETIVLSLSDGTAKYTNIYTGSLYIKSTDLVFSADYTIAENLYPEKYVIHDGEIKRVFKVGRFYTEVESYEGVYEVLSSGEQLYTNEKLEEINECLVKGIDIIAKETVEVSLSDLTELSVINRELKTGEKVYSISGYNLNKDYYFEPILKELGVVSGLYKSRPYLRINQNVSKDILDENTKLYVLK